MGNSRSRCLDTCGSTWSENIPIRICFECILRVIPTATNGQVPYAHRRFWLAAADFTCGYTVSLQCIASVVTYSWTACTPKIYFRVAGSCLPPAGCFG